MRIQLCRLLQGLWRDENVIKEAHRDCEREDGEILFRAETHFRTFFYTERY